MIAFKESHGPLIVKALDCSDQECLSSAIKETGLSSLLVHRIVEEDAWMTQELPHCNQFAADIGSTSIWAGCTSVLLRET